MNRIASLGTALVLIGTAPSVLAAPAAAPAATAELTDIREIGALDQKTLDLAEAAFFEGLGHFRANRFEQAAQAFQKVYTLSRHRDMLYNVARSREKLGDVAGAVEWYRAYLGTRPADETAVIHKIRQLGAEPTVAQAQKPQISGPVGPVETVEKGPGPWPWVAAGAGVLALGAGTVLGFQALGEASKARDSDVRADAKTHKDAAESKALIADVCFGVAGLAAGAAVFLWWRADANASQAGSIDVSVGPRGGGLSYRSSF